MLAWFTCAGMDAAIFYRTNAEAIRPLHEWTSTFERYWAQSIKSHQGTS